LIFTVHFPRVIPQGKNYLLSRPDANISITSFVLSLEAPSIQKLIFLSQPTEQVQEFQ